MLFRSRVHYVDIKQFLINASENSVPVYGTFLDGENIYTKKLTANGIIIMGNEGKGVSKEVAKIVSERLYIPPFPADRQSVESLNVAVATAVVCSEFRRSNS